MSVCKGCSLNMFGGGFDFFLHHIPPSKLRYSVPRHHKTFLSLHQPSFLPFYPVPTLSQTPFKVGPSGVKLPLISTLHIDNLELNAWRTLTKCIALTLYYLLTLKLKNGRPPLITYPFSRRGSESSLLNKIYT